MKKVKHIGANIGKSQYVEGKTDLNQEQKEILESISVILNYYSDNYNNLPKNYAPEGVISILRDQVKAKIENKSINSDEEKKALSLIGKLEKKLTT
ncbi:hypothetical protein ACJ2A9_13685 [Anaerobacillus sp. MEB173]|uniref:hypothetical protein n=1 Tax=Anaerobacillus sp. MEB173 TaxID=3383345 RepID=UPI003F90D5EC